MTEHLQIGREGPIQTLRFNRPEKKNALTSAMYRELTKALRDAGLDDTIRASVFLGQPGIFTAGNDLWDFLAVSQEQSWEGHALDFLFTLAESPKPLIAAVDGVAIGIGVTLLMHCDLAFASSRSTFQTPFVNLGAVPEAASSLIAPRLMGHARAFELLVMGQIFSAERAKEAGLINRVHTPEEVEAAAISAAASLAKKPQEAVRLSRRLLKGDPAEIKSRMKEEVQLFVRCLQSPEAIAALQAFLQKPPKAAEQPGSPSPA
jgi:enoyl-CoA hydratase/carnithine racemase